MTRKRNWSVVPMVLGLLLLIPFFVYFWRVTTVFGSNSDHENFKLFSKSITNNDVRNYLKGIDKKWGYPFYMIAKISAVVALIVGLAIAVVQVLRLLGLEVAIITRILAVIEIVAGALTLVAGILFFIASTSKQGGIKVFASGEVGYYFTVIGSMLCGITSLCLLEGR